MKNQNTQNKKFNTRKLTATAMLTAVAVALQYIEISVPIMPSFIKLDFSDLPELIGAFAYGPVAGVVIALVKNLIHMLVSQTGFVGELSNFVLGAIFAGVAGAIYKHKKTKKTALIGGIAGAGAMAVISVFTNNFIIYPMYYNILGMPKEAILDMYQVIMPSVNSIMEALLIFNLPFNFVKGLLCVAISMVIYKPLSQFLHKK